MHILGHNFKFYLEMHVKNHEDKESLRESIRQELYKHIPAKKLAGLESGSYQMTLHEFAIISEFFEMELNDLIIIDSNNIKTISQVINSHTKNSVRTATYS
jgi:hypothetical protein